MIEIGKKNTLKAIRNTSVGIFLGDEEGNEVLLPNKYVPKTLGAEENIEVFVYKDSEDRVVATTLEPYLMVDEFALLRVNEVAPFGAFMDWGMEKDLLVPFKEQSEKMYEGKEYVVYMYLDNETQRLVGTTRMNKVLNNDEIDFKEGEEVAMMVYENTHLGYFVIIEGKHKGLIYHNEVYKPILPGDILTGYIKKIKENNEIDISLQKIGFEHVTEQTDEVLNYLKANQGFLELTDSSTPEQIAAKLHISKKTFKKSIGILYRQRLIRIEPDGVYLVN
ncbi:MAG: S1-like domain-containing RNA-binding protein [Bacteroidota bacterium]|nr:S1-like domain-containing RNA-binding protein [Bacteroidota bacterium]